MIFEEACDRYGNPPKEVEFLFEVMSLRAFMKEKLIQNIRFSDNKLILNMHAQANVNRSGVLDLVSRHRNYSITSTGSFVCNQVFKDLQLGDLRPYMIERPYSVATVDKL